MLLLKNKVEGENIVNNKLLEKNILEKECSIDLYSY
jgi:hypothetical protein